MMLETSYFTLNLKNDPKYAYDLHKSPVKFPLKFARTTFSGLFAAALPTGPNQLDNEISDNELDFDKELPFEREYYRTSTEHDDFVRPSPTDENTSIEGIDDGIDLNDEAFRSLVPLCNYRITLTDLNGTVDDVAIDIAGLIVKNGRKNNLPLKEFRKVARKQILERIRRASLAQDTQQTVNDVTNYVRQMFTKTYGYEDSCGISITLQTRTQPGNRDESEFAEPTSDMLDERSAQTTARVDVATEAIARHASEDPAADGRSNTLAKPPHDIEVTESQPDATTVDESVEFITEIERVERIVPKSSVDIKAIIDVYKALNNWRFYK